MRSVPRQINTAVMSVISLVFLSPVVLMVLTSMKPESEVLNPASAIPKHWTLSNYAHVLGWSEDAPFGRWLLNSFFISSSVTLAVILLSSMAAFAITRLRVPGGNVFLGIVVASMMVPGQLFLVPLYLMLSRLHWLDTPAALIVPATAGGWGVFMLSQFMRAIPEAVEEAALMDGCTPFGLYLNVSLPLCAPAIATLGILTFVGSWNDFLGPLVFMDSVRNYTLPVGIALYQSSYYQDYGLTLATSVLATAPLVLVFMAFQRQIVESMASTGLKD
ncbi:carbohydrate ABC transporter permease [Fimbriimonas ginsengisoli]|uniref:N-Acetyl-D-glucosamine ABC transport system, permease protein 2 n=1 Tax=Fimbriimonas ginsengisoli Gsoil 348 TaxID=661478 RepID=A0A068NUV6_FIMGI|nr:carbohydrate ABC transporter permease [Fimbriimonas ginsengisoli]AIE87127.1 N-Acetyl-D-glucosamine ABC transport system, permease protein 2 [Fimbriimonas ginsengisoli Gsoil 348]